MHATLKDAINALRWVRPQRLSSISVTHPFIELTRQLRYEAPSTGPALLRQRDAWQRTLLHHAAEHGVTPALPLLLEAGLDIDARDHAGNTPLHWAAQGGHVAFVNDLLMHGADPAACNAAGKTPLQTAPARGYWSIARLCSTHAQPRTERTPAFA